MSKQGGLATEYAEQLSHLGAIAITPTGNSMWPTLKNKRQAVIIKKKEGRLEKFAVALFVLNDKVVLHRVVEVLDDGYKTCGDSQFRTERIKEEQVLGVMDGFYKGKKFISADNEGYKKRVQNWYKNKDWRAFRVSVFYFFERVKLKIKGIFKGKENKNV